MAPINYASNKKKRQTPKSLALKGEAPPLLTSNIVAECPPVVKRGRGRPKKAPEDKASAYIGMFVTPSRKAIYQASAKYAGKTLTHWALDLMDRAAITQP